MTARLVWVALVLLAVALVAGTAWGMVSVNHRDNACRDAGGVRTSTAGGVCIDRDLVIEP